MDAAVLADLVAAAVATDGIEGVVVVRNGYVVAESVMYPFPDDTPHSLRSVTKSVVGTLIGIAVDQGLLAGVDVPVVEILPDHVPASVDELKAAMTVEDLLAMASGLECRDSYLYGWEGMAAMMESDDWVSYVLALPMIDAPGTAFEYCNGASMLLSAILTEVTGETASEFARRELFEPLGITEFTWMETPDGLSVGFMGLWLSPADLAKFGLLYLRDGEWDGDQLVSSEWTDAATTGQIDSGTLSDRYGYQWWIDDGGYSMALGYGGQYVFVAPDHDLVATFVSSLPAERTDEPEQLFNDYVLTAVVSDDPLPPNDGGHDRLAGAVAAARSGPEPTPTPIPAAALAVDGARYEIETNEMDIDALEFRFDEATAIIDAEVAGERFPFKVATDGSFAMTEMPGEPPTAAHGSWSGDAFVVEFHTVGDIERGTWTLSFDDANVYAVMEYDGETIGTFSGRRVD